MLLCDSESQRWQPRLDIGVPFNRWAGHGHPFSISVITRRSAIRCVAILASAFDDAIESACLRVVVPKGDLLSALVKGPRMPVDGNAVPRPDRQASRKPQGGNRGELRLRDGEAAVHGGSDTVELPGEYGLFRRQRDDPTGAITVGARVEGLRNAFGGADGNFATRRRHGAAHGHVR